MRSTPRSTPSALARGGLIAFGAAVGAVLALGVWSVRDERVVYFDPAHEGKRTRYFRPDRELGYGPIPGTTVRARRTVGGRVLYDVIYTIDEQGLRTTPGDPTAPAFLFFCDSLTFGEGVADGETLPAAFGRALGRPANIRNFGFHGYGPHQMVRELELGRAEPLAPAGVAHVFYQSLPSHAARAAGRSSWEIAGPRYVVDGSEESDGGLRYVGPYHSFPVALALRVANRVPPLRVLRLRLLGSEESSAAERDLHARLIRRAAALARDRLRAPFTVLHWDYGTPEDDGFIARLGEAGIDVLRVSQILPRERWADLEVSIPFDRHPTAATYEILGRGLARRYGGETPLGGR